MAAKDAMAEAGKRWKQLTEQEKAPYQKKHEEDAKRYEINFVELIFRY
jgi:hypothetical protein